jgi:ribonuclease D
MLITTSSALSEFCAALRGAPYIAVDTEFMREKSYYAYLCLIQVAYGEHAAAIDPLAKDLDMTPLWELLRDPGVVKVFHAAGQDLEIFHTIFKEVPGPVFDTQIAASVCGLGEQPGYAKLVSSLLGIDIDKSSQATDWSLRPLTDRQLSYALSDVTHLCVLYEKLLAKLSETKRTSWVSQEMAGLLDASRYVVEPSEAWRRVRTRRPKRRTLAVLRELAKWREEEAMSRDIPRGWLLRNEAMIEIAQGIPKDVAALSRVRGLKHHVARGEDGRAILSAVERALASPESDWPPLPPPRPPKMDRGPLVALLNALLQQRCRENDVSTGMIARRGDLEEIAAGREDVAALKGWRRTIFGEDALELCAGRLALTGENGEVIDGEVVEGE